VDRELSWRSAKISSPLPRDRGKLEHVREELRVGDILAENNRMNTGYHGGANVSHG